MSDIQLNPEQIKLVNLLEKFFYPLEEASIASFFTTSELYGKLQSLWPSSTYTTEDVLAVLMYKGYRRFNSETTDKVFWNLQFKGE